MSPQAAGLAKKMGYTNIKVMLKGAPGWEKAGQFLVASDTFINEGNIILVDLRDPEEAAKGHIKRAVNIPFDELEDFDVDFPFKAPVVVYGDAEESKDAVKMINSWGLKTVALVHGGLDGYVARGNELVSGQPETEISWVRKLGKGEVSVEEFMQVAEGNTPDKLILDVRAPSETAEGRFANALTAPLDNLEKQLSSLPQDKELLVHCSTGARAEMAHDILQKAGFQSRFLVANVQCTGVGDCTVE